MGVHARLGRALVAWYARHHRALPWRETRDPYRILVSEIMLQQTRAQAVIPFYGRFLARFPDAPALAAAPEPEVLTLWSGLGYYARARNLHAAARRIAAGGFPREYAAIRELPGVGDYTAAAVASIAFDLPHAAVDGNVLRVVARLENDASDIGSSRTRRRFAALAGEMLDGAAPGDFNQALMELGATICLPRAPQCRLCPLAEVCRARAAGAEQQLPVKLRRTEPQAVELSLAVIRRAGRVFLRERPAGVRRLAGFWELPPLEEIPGARRGGEYGTFRHSITHHRYRITVVAASARAPRGGRWFLPAELFHIPLSSTARKALKLAAIL
jgi:A/G-specific adenine glycosylase